MSETPKERIMADIRTLERVYAICEYQPDARATLKEELVRLVADLRDLERSS
jgi:hypothetical protein